MRWKLFGIVPVMRADGPDVSRSAKGRLELESLWLPSVLVGRDIARRVRGEDVPYPSFDQPTGLFAGIRRIFGAG